MEKDPVKIAQGKRLAEARKLAGYRSAREAALENNWPESSYRAHEGGTRTIGQNDAERYAKRFGNTTAEHILFGSGGIDAAAPPAKSAMPEPNATYPLPVTFSHKKLPVYGHAAGGMDDDGKFILNGQKIADVLCPPALENVVGAYAVYHTGDSMLPRYEPGDLLTIHPGLPVKKGDYVLVQIRGEDGDPPYGYVKRFVTKNAKELVLEQLNPPDGHSHTLRFPSDRVLTVHRIFSSGIG